MSLVWIAVIGMVALSATDWSERRRRRFEHRYAHDPTFRAAFEKPDTVATLIGWGLAVGLQLLIVGVIVILSRGA
jgi:hypothetical protein